MAFGGLHNDLVRWERSMQLDANIVATGKDEGIHFNFDRIVSCRVATISWSIALVTSRHLPALNRLHGSTNWPTIFAGSRDSGLQHWLWLFRNRVDHIPCDCFQWNLDSSLPTTIELPCRLPDVDVDKSSSWWTLRDWANKVWRTISTIAFDVDRAFENEKRLVVMIDCEPFCIALRISHRALSLVYHLAIHSTRRVQANHGY